MQASDLEPRLKANITVPCDAAHGTRVGQKQCFVATKRRDRWAGRHKPELEQQTIEGDSNTQARNISPQAKRRPKTPHKPQTANGSHKTHTREPAIEAVLYNPLGIIPYDSEHST